MLIKGYGFFSYVFFATLLAMMPLKAQPQTTDQQKKPVSQAANPFAPPPSVTPSPSPVNPFLPPAPSPASKNSKIYPELRKKIQSQAPHDVTPRGGTGATQAMAPGPLETEAKPENISTRNLIEGVINEQLAALREGDYSKAYYAFTTKDFQKNVPLDVFRNFVRNNLALYRNKGFALKEISFRGTVAYAKGLLIAADDKTIYVRYELISDRGTWEIRRIDLLLSM